MVDLRSAPPVPAHADPHHPGESAEAQLRRRLDHLERKLAKASVHLQQERARNNTLLQELAQRGVELQTADRNRMQFLAMLSHELRTPLTPVLTAAAALEQDQTLTDDLRATARMIRRNVELEARLIDDLLDISRIQSGKLTLKMQPTNLHDAIEGATDVCAPDIRGQGITLEVRLSATRHYVRGDSARLQQVFWNLIKNAIKFTEPGGRISIQSSDGEHQQVQVQITDTGVGVSPDMLQRIFEAFQQVEGPGQKRGGLGLGLAISKSLIDAHEGSLSASSRGLGQGTTFTVTLPTVAPPARKVEVASVVLPGPARRRDLRILLVEDHADTAQVLGRLLGAQGYEVTVAGDATTAQIAFSASAFDLVVCDIGLPDGNGLDLMRQMQSIRPVRGIAMTGFGMDDDIKNSRAAGFFTHLTKPINFQQLHAIIQEAMA